jgi:hypothetical protein
MIQKFLVLNSKVLLVLLTLFLNPWIDLLANLHLILLLTDSLPELVIGDIGFEYVFDIIFFGELIHGNIGYKAPIEVDQQVESLEKDPNESFDLQLILDLFGVLVIYLDMKLHIEGPGLSGNPPHDFHLLPDPLIPILLLRLLLPQAIEHGQGLLDFLLDIQVNLVHVVEEGVVEVGFRLLDLAVQKLQVLHQPDLRG